MQKRIVVSNGKRFLVNVPGWEDGVGAGCPSGTAWLSDGTDWYSVQLTGLSGSLSFQTPTQLIIPSVGQYANDYGFQLVMADDGLVYEVSIVAGAVSIAQTPSSLQSSKPFLFLQSKTDGAYYYVSAKNTAGTITLVINDNTRMDATLVKSLN